MIKKICLILLCLLLVSCSKETKDQVIDNVIENESIYVEPIKDAFLFSELNDSTKQRWNKIIESNKATSVENYQLTMLFKETLDYDFLDIDGNTINLNNYDHLLLEVVSYTCNHCKNEIVDYMNDIANEFDDVAIIQYFDKGSKQDILDFYSELNISIPENIIIVSEDDKLHDYIKYELETELYPTFIFFNKQKVSFNMIGEMTYVSYKKAYDIAFDNVLTNQDLVNSDGVDIFTLSRSEEEVKSDLSKENQNKVSYLGEELVYKVMGNTLNFYDVLDGSDRYISTIQDFTYYKDKDLVLIYEQLKDESETDKIEFINSLLSDKSVEYIVVLIEGFESSSNIYNKMDVKLDCPVVSILGRMPKDFYKFGLSRYPSALFVQNGVFTGAYVGIKDNKNFSTSIDTYLKDTSIALKKNN